jgi:hypothetical protein
VTRRALALAAALAGCIDNAPVEPPTLDRARFAADVQPHLAARCASPPCHGSDRRRLRVYAPGLFRADATRTHRDEPLTPAELAANERSAAAFAQGAPAAARSVQRHLARQRLGHGHLAAGRPEGRIAALVEVVVQDDEVAHAGELEVHLRVVFVHVGLAEAAVGEQRQQLAHRHLHEVDAG